MSKDKLRVIHWRLFAYAEVCCVDAKGVIDPLRINDADLDGMDDLEEAGLLKNNGTGIQPFVELTDLGWAIASQIRQHKARGGQLSAFTPVWPEPSRG